MSYTNIVNNLFKNRLISEAENISETIHSFRTTFLNNAKNINYILIDFNPTPDITTHVSTFTDNINDYFLDLSNPKSNFIGEIADFLINNSCVQVHLPFSEIDLTNIADSWSKILSSLKMPGDFLYMIEDFTFKTLLDSVVSDYPYPEFELGKYLSILKINSQLMNIPNLLSKLDSIITCVDGTFSVDLSYMRNDVNGYLTRILFDTNGYFDYSVFSEIPSESTDIIKQIDFNIRVILNNTQNEMAKVKDVFEKLPIII